MANVSISVDRESVCAGDDCEAHLRQIVVSEMMPLKFVIQDLLDSGYLPRISGGFATWVVWIERPVAVVDQQWKGVQFVVDADFPVSKFLGPDCRIQFKYETQREPDGVFRRIAGGKTTPARKGRKGGSPT